MNKSKKGKMPVQGAPIVRGANQGTFSNGVEAQSFWRTLGSIGESVLPIIAAL